MKNNSLPVLTYHSIAPGEKIDPSRFETHLAVLADSDLPSLAPHELEAAPKGFLLTFDDGFADLWTHAFPLLQKYGIKAVVFVIPSRVGNGPARPLGLKTFKGNANLAHYEAADTCDGHAAFLRWSELKAMEASGLLTVQSHSYYHRMGWVGKKITGFHLPPKTPAHWSLGQATGGDVRPGIPTYKRGSALGHRLYFDDPGLRDFLFAWLDRQGIEDYIGTRGVTAITQKLFALAQSYHLKYPDKGRWEKNDERETRCREDIAKARQVLSEKLGGSRDELCLPWGHYDQTTIEVAGKTGIKRIYTLDKGSNPAGRIGMSIRRFEPRPNGAWWLKTRLWIYRSVLRAEIYKRLSSGS